MEIDAQKVAERILDLRKSRGLTIFQMDAASGISHAAISRWENAIALPSTPQLYKLAKFFNVSTDYILGIED